MAQHAGDEVLRDITLIPNSEEDAKRMERLYAVLGSCGVTVTRFCEYSTCPALVLPLKPHAETVTFDVPDTFTQADIERSHGYLARLGRHPFAKSSAACSYCHAPRFASDSADSANGSLLTWPEVEDAMNRWSSSSARTSGIRAACMNRTQCLEGLFNSLVMEEEREEALAKGYGPSSSSAAAASLSRSPIPAMTLSTWHYCSTNLVLAGKALLRIQDLPPIFEKIDFDRLEFMDFEQIHSVLVNIKESKGQAIQARFMGSPSSATLEKYRTRGYAYSAMIEQDMETMLFKQSRKLTTKKHPYRLKREISLVPLLSKDRASRGQTRTQS